MEARMSGSVASNISSLPCLADFTLDRRSFTAWSIHVALCDGLQSMLPPPPPLIKREKEEEEVVEGTRTFLERTRWEFQFDGGHPLCECLGAVHDINCRRILMNLAQQDLLQSLNSLLTAHQAHC